MANSFTDETGDTWTLRVTTGTLFRVRERLGVHLLDLFSADGQKFAELCSDPIQLATIIYLVCRDEAESRKLTEIDFYDLIFADTLESATEALMEAIANFFPNPQQRKAANAILGRIKLLRKRMMEMGQTKLETALEGIDLESLAGQESNRYAGSSEV